MKCFTDAVGTTWTIAVNVSSLRRVKALCGVMLTDIVTLEPGKRPNTDLLEQLASDPVLLVDVLYALVKPEADQKGISDETFGTAMVGDVLESAVSALLDEVIAFFPSAKRRVMERLVQAGRRFAERQQEALDVLLGAKDLDTELDRALEKSNTSFSGSPGLLVSTPVH